MPIIRKRRAQAEPSPSPPPARRRKSSSVSEASSNEDGEGNTGLDGNTQGGASSHGQMVKKLVRLALACEYSRQPIRRAEITSKASVKHERADGEAVMAPNTGRQFKLVFKDAQHQLRSIFGMEITELPQKEKITISQKRAAQRSQSAASSSSKAYVLTSILPAAYRVPSILAPARIPSTTIEASYTGFYHFVISIISLSPRGTISESRLERHLKRMNADNYVLNGEKTEKILKRMEREGYVVKVRERDGIGEESIEYVVGPRGKAEVGERGVAGVVRKVYGKRDAEADELDKKLVRSLGEVALEKKSLAVEAEGGEVGEDETADSRIRDERGNGRDEGRRSSGRHNRRSRGEVAADEEEDEVEDEDEDEGEEEGEEEEDEEEDEEDQV
ncbi:hypothetical protein MMC07_007027 [Pseudocyphellaria aurata]|nr:hypothetical protein [Pseudocyphellaria aurata]